MIVQPLIKEGVYVFVFDCLGLFGVVWFGFVWFYLFIYFYLGGAG